MASHFCGPGVNCGSDLWWGPQAQRIRKTSWGKNILLLAVTGWGQKEDIQRDVNAGFNFHMTKPADPARVEQLVRDFLASKGASNG